ncbi:MAG: hypothetical protein PF574_10675 [Candidatus Delongbacteria bacterium]|jgi:hypothetical protein|nr:hypothetical protein [Candidatus Delongbacteria bacterium]
MQTTTQLNKTLSSSSWDFNPTKEQEEKKSFSPDEVINAYFKGKEDFKNKVIKVFEKNLEVAQEKGELFYNFISKKKVKNIDLYLKAESVTDFCLLFLIDKKQYLSDKAKDIYKESIKEKLKLNSEKFHLEFTFMPITKTLNQEKIISEGFLLKYDKK